ncbi:MAG: hypothetical protein OXE92_09685 [Bacteroidetes bacterium]|nr:hypothetical protein [Bacteroidota bacterium]MCY4205979.1 hypothetical protein [Bacteroidota bacterium]
MYRILLLILLIFCTSFSESKAQEGFGAMNRLSEKLARQRWQTLRQINAMGGVSLIGPQWRGVMSLNMEYASYPFAVRLYGSIRQGPLGQYAPDWDEAYDVLRLIQFARVQTEDVYVRIGPIEDMRLGIGHVVNHYRSSTSWDTRTIGVEAAWSRGIIEFSGFSADLFLNNLIGARIGVDLPYSSKLGINYSNHLPTDLVAWSVDLNREIFETARVAFAPYISYAWYSRYGDGLAFGADVRSTDFIDLLSFRLRVGAFYSSRNFIPGYVGTLFNVSNPHNRIIRDGADLQNIKASDFSGILLQESRGVNDLLTEFELQIRDTFWFAYSWRRHFGTQPLSELYFRLFIRAGTYFNLEVGIDRLGEKKITDVFTSFSEQSRLLFATILHIKKSFFLRTGAQYTFEPLESEEHYLVQRRFEPTLGIRLNY